MIISKTEIKYRSYPPPKSLVIKEIRDAQASSSTYVGVLAFKHFHCLSIYSNVPSNSVVKISCRRIERKHDMVAATYNFIDKNGIEIGFTGHLI